MLEFLCEHYVVTFIVFMIIFVGMASTQGDEWQ